MVPRHRAPDRSATEQLGQDVRVQTVAAGTGVQPGGRQGSAIGLAVVGSADALEIAGLGTPNCHPIGGHPDCSVLVVRH
jgi:hypothetical protein